MTLEKVVDPKDDTEKVILSNFASGATGNLVLIDPVTGEGESLPLPGDEGGEGLLNLDNEKLLVGTASAFGYLHVLELRNRTWRKPLRDPDNNYIWNMCLGSDGMVYGGTYPGCALLRYDMARHELENLGRVSDDPANLYSRFVYGGIPGYILIDCMSNSQHLSLWSIDARQARRFGKPGAKLKEITSEFICTQTNGTLDFYDPHTFEELPGDLASRLTPPVPVPVRGASSPVKFNDGSLVGYRGQEYFYLRTKGTKPEIRPVPTERPATGIHTIISDPNGKIWGCSNFGQTIFSFDPASGKVWNSQVVCDNAGEVYGMAFAGGKLFMAAYAGGDHIVYDPETSWDQMNNVNPRTLEPVSPRLIRPSGRSVIGPDGNFWTGWMAKYGVYGGGLSCVDTRTLKVSSWYDPVPKQAIGGLTADDRYLYFVTNGDSNGLPEGSGPFHFVVWDANGKIVRDISLAADEKPGSVLALGERVVLRMDRPGGLRIFNPNRLEFEANIPFPEGPRTMAPMGADRLAVFTNSRLAFVNPKTREVTFDCDLPSHVHSATITPDGVIYFAAELNLYRLTS